MITKICLKTRKFLNEWENPYGYAPDSASRKIEKAMFSWMKELTDCLKIWTDKGETMTDGELILARANIGSLVESWLKFFYCVYYEDYLRAPTYFKGKIIEPNKMKFEYLKTYSRGKLWEENDNWDIWIDKIQTRRNAIHSFNFKDIGTNEEFITDIDKFNDFIELVFTHLPESPQSARESY